MNNLIFVNKEYFWLLLILIPMIFWYIFKKRNSQATITFSDTKNLIEGKNNIKRYLRHIIFILRISVISLLIIILARPQSINKQQEEQTEGIDIVIALDISGSMLAQDFKPNRLEASKDVAIEFISGRPLDEIGLIIFSGESYTQCPLTTDHVRLKNLFEEVKQGIIEDGTAIGVGLANAVNRLKDSKAVSKVVILLTDGVSNVGEIAPLTAADLAAKYGVRVYTIGVGKNGYAPYPVQTIFGTQIQQVKVEIDEKTLRKIAEKTDGQYFRATNNNKLKEIYQEIDKLEKSKIQIKKYSIPKEEYWIFALIAGILLILEITLKLTVFRNIP